MDGATNVNPSNTPQVLTPREGKKIQRSLAKEASAAEKHLAQVTKALKSAEKEEVKIEKSIQKAQRAREKAVKKERKTAKALTDAQHKHDLAAADEKKAMNNLSMCQTHLQQAQQTIGNRRAELEQVQSKKVSGDASRAEQLRNAQRGMANGAS